MTDKKNEEMNVEEEKGFVRWVVIIQMERWC